MSQLEQSPVNPGLVHNLLTWDGGPQDPEEQAGCHAPCHPHTLLTWDGRPQDPEERAGFDSFLSTLMGWCLALMPTFAPHQTVKVLSSMAKLELYSEEVRGWSRVSNARMLHASRRVSGCCPAGEQHSS
eukprot:scaffold7073_cov16-Tisochrysis_lutea.AAC.1